MTLEDILKTAKQDLWDRPDEWIRKQYQKVGDKIPKRAFYPCTTLLGVCLGIPEMGWVSHFLDPGYVIPLDVTFSHFNILQQDTMYNLNGLFGWVPHPSDSAGRDILDEKIVRWNLYNSYMRFPVLVAGAFFSAVALYSLKEGGGHPLFDAFTAEGFFAIASSMYLKDRDPKQFKKDPFWKRAYDAVTEKAKEYLPQPFPVPAQVSIPARAYVSVETVASL